MPYVPIDRVTSVDPSRATAIKNVTFTEDYLATHFPMFPVVPGAMMIDSLVELSSVLLEAAIGPHGGVTVEAARRARFKRFVRPGDQLVITAELVELDREARTATVDGSLRVDGEEASAIGALRVRWRDAPAADGGERGQ
jgi:3-hydroxyacyl-[acyl-carrier-protein] dehydratase